MSSGGSSNSGSSSSSSSSSSSLLGGLHASMHEAGVPAAAAVSAVVGTLHSHGPAADACRADSLGAYDRPLHIAAVFIVMATSFISTLIPILFRRLVSSSTGKVVLAHMKLFGAGVILSTALVHMYAHASEALSNPCLPPPFTSYGSFAAVFLVAGIFMTHFVQVAASSHSPPHTDAEIQPILGQPGRHEQAPGIDSDPGCNTDDTSMESDALEQDDETKHNHLHGGLILHSPNTPVLLILLEFGIAMHSIIIGLTLGLARGSQLHSLLFAITVHQFFEGLALSAIVLSSPSSSASSSSASASLTTPVVSISTSTLLIVALYTLSTPAGITAGILLHSTFEQYATTVILLTGVLDALGAGILLYDSLANIIVPHFTSEAFKNDVWSNKGGQLLSMYGGSAVMAVIGHWA